jgi:signal-transduction protein with cAMP-binding, CBS, and nucleotidyltransferase domain
MASEFVEVIKAVKKQMERAVEESVVIVEADSKLLCPVDTGTLKRSIAHEVNSSENKVKGAVGTNVDYAYFAEKKQPYLEPAVDQNMETIKRKMAEVLNNVHINSEKIIIKP